MVKRLKRIAFVVEDFAVPSPAQQLLDRFLVGYPLDGKFPRRENCRISVHLAGGAAHAELERRRKDFRLEIRPTVGQAVAQADAVVVVWHGQGALANEELLRGVLEYLPKGAACFVHGALGRSLDGAKELVTLAASRSVRLLAGTALGTTWRLPNVEVPKGTPLKEGLIVVQGTSPAAEFAGLEGLLPLLERRAGGESGIRSAQFFSGEDLWRARAEGQWSWPLLAAALSRSDSPQGDALKDGRTQDLAGLGLVPKLAPDPRGWLLVHRDGLRSGILVLNGVVADYNFAVGTQSGSVISAQIYRPPAPAEHQYSRLAAVIEDFFRGGETPWPVERSLLIAGLLDTFQKLPSDRAQLFETPGLASIRVPSRFSV